MNKIDFIWGDGVPGQDRVAAKHIASTSIERSGSAVLFASQITLAIAMRQRNPDDNKDEFVYLQPLDGM